MQSDRITGTSANFWLIITELTRSLCLLVCKRLLFVSSNMVMHLFVATTFYIFQHRKRKQKHQLHHQQEHRKVTILNDSSAIHFTFRNVPQNYYLLSLCIYLPQIQQFIFSRFNNLYYKMTLYLNGHDNVQIQQ